MKFPIYLDYNATTPVAPRIKKAMLPYFEERFGNPSTSYVYGMQAKQAIDTARGQVAALIGAEPEEIVFTSGGTESDNQAIIGAALSKSDKGKHIITSIIEHSAVANTCRYLKDRLGFEITYLPVDKYGVVSPEQLRSSIRKDTILITIMHANNEVGTIEPLQELGAIANESGILFHTDAAQTVGKIDMDVNRLGVDLLSFSGHKLYSPKGIGALYIKKGTQIDSFVHGAGQEKSRRAGTENVPYIVGLGVACELARSAIPEYGRRVRDLRDRLFDQISSGLGNSRVVMNGHPEKRLLSTLSISIAGVNGEELLHQIPELATSTGSACHSGSNEPSSVLTAMGVEKNLAMGTLRLSLGLMSTREEIDKAAELLVGRVKAFSQKV